MAKFIRHSSHETYIEYRLCFDVADREPYSRCGWSFECDKHGNVDTSKFQPAALENYRKCLLGEHATHKPYIDKHESDYKVCAIVECGCGHHVELFHYWLNTCEKCGQDFNGSGQELADRSQWGEETGEHPADIERY